MIFCIDANEMADTERLCPLRNSLKNVGSRNGRHTFEKQGNLSREVMIFGGKKIADELSRRQ